VPPGVPTGELTVAVKVTVWPGAEVEELLVMITLELIFGRDMLAVAEVLVRNAVLDGLNVAERLCWPAFRVVTKNATPLLFKVVVLFEIAFPPS
jgi:hypothetical protein